MINEIDAVKILLMENNYRAMLKSLGVDKVYVAPVWEMMPDGREFSWHKAFINADDAEKARIKFMNGI